MKRLSIVILLGVILIVSGCTNTQNDAASQTANTENPNEKVSAPKKDLKDIVGLQTKYSADYDVTSNGQVVKMTMIFALPKFATSAKTPEGDVKAIFDGSSFISCSNTDGTWQCLKIQADEPANIEIENSIKSGASKTTFIGTCSYAGLKGSNYEIETDGEKSTACYTDDGILLEVKTPDSSMVATRVSRTVSDSDFVPPAEPQDLAAIVQGYR